MQRISFIFTLFLSCLNFFVSFNAHAEVIKAVDFEAQVAFQEMEKLKQAISTMIQQAGYTHDPASLTIDRSQKTEIVIADTNEGKKFIKVKRRGKGINEYLGALLFKDFVRVIPTEKVLIARNMELLIQPFIPSIAQESGLLFDAICQLEFQENPDTWELLNSLFSDCLKMHRSTMHYSPMPARNNEFFYNRLQNQAQDGISGRIEQIYAGKNFKFMDLEFPWEELKTLNWCIDGIEYRETLEDLLAKARVQLHPGQPKLMGYSHGNWHENNVIIHGVDHLNVPYEYAYTALEFAGENDLIADAAMFLVHTTVYADYLNPVFYPTIHGNHASLAKLAQKSAAQKERTLLLNKSNKLLNINGIELFGTLDSRKLVAQVFEKNYFKPLEKLAVEHFGEQLSPWIDHHLKSALLLRLLGGQNLLKISPEAQLKLIGLIYKSIGTPVTGAIDHPTFTRYLNAL